MTISGNTLSDGKPRDLDDKQNSVVFALKISDQKGTGDCSVGIQDLTISALTTTTTRESVFGCWLGKEKHNCATVILVTLYATTEQPNENFGPTPT